MNSETHSTRQHILDVGYQLFVEKGFSNVGLAQLLSHAGVPKGSFYHYFKSKEQFGQALIEEYFTHYQTRLNALFADPNTSGYDKLMSYWHKWIEVNDGVCGSQRCLVVKLSAEVSDLSDAMREALLLGANQVIARLSLCAQQGIDDGSIALNDAQRAAEHLYQLWIGASLLSKLQQNSAPMQHALISTERLLKGQSVF